MPTERSIVLAQQCLEFSAVLCACIPVRPVDPASMPCQPAPRFGIDVLSVTQIKELVLK